jgi:glycyl-tRNA synthetase beta subunit
LFNLLKENGASSLQAEALLQNLKKRVFLNEDELASIPKRLAALQEFSALPEAESLAAANKRIVNILKKNGLGDLNNPKDFMPLPSEFVSEQEKDLYNLFVKTINPAVKQAMNNQDYSGALKELVKAKDAIAQFSKPEPSKFASEQERVLYNLFAETINIAVKQAMNNQDYSGVLKGLLKDAIDQFSKPEPSKFASEQERVLYNLFVETINIAVKQAMNNQDYSGALKELAKAKDDIDQFFCDVMVMDKDEEIKKNRLRLLVWIKKTMNSVAEISALAH